MTHKDLHFRRPCRITGWQVHTWNSIQNLFKPEKHVACRISITFFFTCISNIPSHGLSLCPYVSSRHAMYLSSLSIHQLTAPPRWAGAGVLCVMSPCGVRFKVGNGVQCLKSWKKRRKKSHSKKNKRTLKNTNTQTTTPTTTHVLNFTRQTKPRGSKKKKSGAAVLLNTEGVPTHNHHSPDRLLHPPGGKGINGG